MQILAISVLYESTRWYFCNVYCRKLIILFQIIQCPKQYYDGGVFHNADKYRVLPNDTFKTLQGVFLTSRRFYYPKENKVAMQHTISMVVVFHGLFLKGVSRYQMVSRVSRVSRAFLKMCFAQAAQLSRPFWPFVGWNFKVTRLVFSTQLFLKMKNRYKNHFCLL